MEKEAESQDEAVCLLNYDNVFLFINNQSILTSRQGKAFMDLSGSPIEIIWREMARSLIRNLL